MKEAIEILKEELKKLESEEVLNHPLNKRYHKGEVDSLKRAIKELKRRVFVEAYINGEIQLAKSGELGKNK